MSVWTNDIPIRRIAVDGHLCLVVDAHVFDLVNPPDALHVSSSITTSTEDQCNTRVRVDVLRRDEGSGGVVDERVKLCGHILGTPKVK